MTNYVVTGGAGAIGSRLVRRLLADGAEKVTVIDDLSSGYTWLLPDDDRLCFYEADVAVDDFGELKAEGAVIFHLAAHFANQNSVDHPERDLAVNGLGTLRVLKWAEKSRASRLVYASAGCSIAGHDVVEPICEAMPVSLHMSTPYQITKALGEYYCNYFDSRGLPTVCCRFFNSYGPGEVPGKYRNVIPNFVWRAMNGLPLVITGTGEETRDFIYVEDLVDGLVRAARSGLRASAVNLGTGRQTSVEHLAEIVLRATGSRSAVEHVPRRDWDKSFRRSANINKARTALGFNPHVTVEDGVLETVAWFREYEGQITASVADRGDLA